MPTIKKFPFRLISGFLAGMLFVAGCARSEPVANIASDVSTSPATTLPPSTTRHSPSPARPTNTKIPTATENPAPAWFDSLFIAYSQYGKPGIWMWRKGVNAQLAPVAGYKIRICEAGDHLAYDAGGNLVIYDRETGEETSLPVGQYLGALEEFSWIPGSQEMVFTSSRSSTMDNDGAYISWATGLFRVAAGSSTWELVLEPDKATIDFRPSDDGGKILLAPATGENIGIVNIDGTQYRSIQINSAYVRYQGFAWPQGAGDLYLATVGKPYSYGSTFLMRIPGDGSSPTVNREFPNGYQLEFSPDGKRYIGYANRYDRIPGFTISGLTTTESQFVNNVTIHAFLGWSPNSRSYAFLSTDGKIYIGEYGSEPIPVLVNMDPFDDPCFRWADNQFYFYCLQEKGLYLASAETRRQPMQILDESISVDAFDFYYDGK